MKKHLQPFFISVRNNLTALALFFLIWGGCSIFFPDYIIPSPLLVVGNTAAYLKADFPGHLAVTLYRVCVGFAWAFVLGTVIGILATIFHEVQHLPTLMVLFQVIPGTVLGIIFLLIFGIGHPVPIALVAFLTLPVVVINTAGGLAKRNILLEDLVRNQGGTRYHLLRHVYVPLLIPTFQSTITIGFSLSLKVVILGEFIGSQEGIGYLMNRAKVYFKMDDVFFYLSVILCIMVCFQIVQQFIFTVFLGKYFYPD